MQHLHRNSITHKLPGSIPWTRAKLTIELLLNSPTNGLSASVKPTAVYLNTHSAHSREVPAHFMFTSMFGNENTNHQQDHTNILRERTRPSPKKTKKNKQKQKKSKTEKHFGAEKIPLLQGKRKYNALCIITHSKSIINTFLH